MINQLLLVFAFDCQANISIYRISKHVTSRVNYLRKVAFRWVTSVATLATLVYDRRAATDATQNTDGTTCRYTCQYLYFKSIKFIVYVYQEICGTTLRVACAQTRIVDICTRLLSSSTSRQIPTEPRANCTRMSQVTCPTRIHLKPYTYTDANCLCSVQI